MAISRLRKQKEGGELPDVLINSKAGTLPKVQLRQQACALSHCSLYLPVVTVTSSCSSDPVHETRL